MEVRQPYVEQLRLRLSAMSDHQLRQFGRAADKVCQGKEPREEFIIQLIEARAEWNRRHPRAKVALKLSRQK